MKQKYRYLIILVTALVGCGGGGSNSETPEQVNPAPQLTGLIDFAIDVVKGGLVHKELGTYSITDCWGAVYKKGESCNPHAHHPAIWSFVYYVDATPEDAPLVFPTSGNAIYPNSGLMIVFPGWVTHSVPPQVNEKERVVIAGNLTIDRPQAKSV